MADRYWIGDGGSWADTAHWSASSGGAGGETAPGINDAAFFDSNSFTTGGQTVTADAVSILLRTMDWTGVTNSPTFANGTVSSFSVSRDLIFSTAMTVSLTGPSSVRAFTGSEPPAGTYTVDLGSGMPSAIFLIDGRSDVTRNIVRNIDVSRLDLGVGTIEFNNYSVDAGALRIESTSSIYNFGTSQITLGGFNLFSGRIISIRGTTPTFNGTPNFILNGGGIIYSDTASSSLYYVLVNGSFVTFNLNGFTTIETLEVASGSLLKFTSNTTTTTVTFIANGSPSNLITINSTTSGIQGVIYSSSPSVSYIDVKDSYADGNIPFYNIPGGVDSRNNTNWAFPGAEDFQEIDNTIGFKGWYRVTPAQLIIYTTDEGSSVDGVNTGKIKGSYKILKNKT